MQGDETMLTDKRWQTHMDEFDIPKDAELRLKVAAFAVNYTRRNEESITKKAKQEVFDDIENSQISLRNGLFMAESHYLEFKKKHLHPIIVKGKQSSQ